MLALRATLEGEGNTGYEIVEARSGKEALRCLLHQEFAVILMDLDLGDMDGFEAMSLIRERLVNQHTPVIFYTANYPGSTSKRGRSSSSERARPWPSWLKRIH